MRKTVLVLVILLTTGAMLFATGSQQTGPASTTKLTVEVFDRGSDGGRTPADNNMWTDWIKEKVKKDLNIDVTFQPVGRWTETTDIVNLLASGSAPDLCYSYNQEAIITFSQQGGLLDLAPYVDRLLPDMKKKYGDDPAIPGQDFIYRNRDKATGKLYSITAAGGVAGWRNIFIRKDWLDKLGLPLPTTTQQFHDALVAFRDRDPGNVGRNNVIPYGQDSDARWGFASIVHAYFDPKLSQRDMWIARFSDRPITVPGYKDGLRLINQWYNEGLIYKDFPLMKVTEDYYNLIKTGVVGAFSGNWDIPYRQDYKIQDEMAKNVPGAQFVPVDCIQGPDGITWKDIPEKAGGFRIFVPSSSKNPEAALKYLNWLSIYDNFHYLQVGIEGINHTIVNGVPQAKTAVAPYIFNSPNNADYNLAVGGVVMPNPDLNMRVLALSYGNTPPEFIMNAYSMGGTNGRAVPVLPGAVTTKLGAYGTNLSAKADALIAQAVTATTANFDRVWDDGMRDYLASGAQEVMDERASLWK